MNENRKELGDEREAYFPPKLKVFGPVGALTQSGTGAVAERNMMGMCDKDTDQQMC